jgi:outer membrane protein OmpA-like peptidoglycan-associated protein
LEGTSDKDSYHLILFKSSGEIAALKAPYLPKEWLVRFQQELKDGLSAPAIRKQELLLFELKPIYFDSDQALIKAEYEDYLREVIRMVKSHSDLRIEITGHTDADGSDAYNMILSRKRSEALIAFLEANGLPKNRVVVRYKGEREPIDSNTTESGKLHNRRIDIRFI